MARQTRPMAKILKCVSHVLLFDDLITTRRAGDVVVSSREGGVGLRRPRDGRAGGYRTKVAIGWSASTM